jgi:outer membrane protein assembly factor BamB
MMATPLFSFASRSLASLLALGWVGAAWAADWPQWRGPNRDDCSTETGLLAEWPANGPPLLWKANALGGGYSAPSVAAGRVFGMGFRGEDEVIWALDASDGKEIWSTRINAATSSFGYPEGPRCTPTIDGALLFALGPAGDLVCLETATGKQVWSKDLVKDFGGQMMSGWGYSESPLVDGDKVVCTPGGPQGTIMALNKKTGQLIWRTKDFTDKAAYASLIRVEIAGVPQYIQLTGASVVGVGTDGALLWRAPRHGNTAVIPTPIFHDNLVFVTSGYGIGCNCFEISASGGQFKAQTLYENKLMANHHGGVVLRGDCLYGYSESKGWVCQDFKTGEIKWSERQKAGKGSLTFADGHLYLRNENGPLTLIEATPAGYKETGKFEQPERSDKNSWPHPVIANGNLYLRDQDKLFCYDLRIAK